MIRKSLLLLGSLISLGFVAVSVILGVAHWQIRQVEPALPTAPDIAQALEETDSAAAISYINTATQTGQPGVMLSRCLTPLPKQHRHFTRLGKALRIIFGVE